MFKFMQFDISNFLAPDTFDKLTLKGFTASLSLGRNSFILQITSLYR